MALNLKLLYEEQMIISQIAMILTALKGNLFMPEMLERREREHRLLIAILHVLIRDDEEHRGVGLLASDKIQRRAFVHDNTARIDPVLPQNVEMCRRLSRVVNPRVNLIRLDTAGAQIAPIKAEHHGQIAAR